MWKWSTRDARIFTAKTSSGKCLCFRKDLIHTSSGWILYLQPEPQNNSITALTCTLRYSMSQVSVECLCKAYWPTTLLVAAPLVAGWRKFDVRCTAATMPALPASPLCRWESGFLVGNFAVVTWSPTSSPFAAALFGEGFLHIFCRSGSDQVSMVGLAQLSEDVVARVIGHTADAPAVIACCCATTRVLFAGCRLAAAKLSGPKVYTLPYARANCVCYLADE